MRSNVYRFYHNHPIFLPLPTIAFAYISSSTGDVTATAGSSITLEVTAFGVPTPITYQWIKDGVVIPGETSNTLTFDKVNINDIGEYVCIPSNIGGSHNATTMVLSVNGELSHLNVCIHNCL